MNRQEITKEHCINKDKPEMNCKGQCHLKKQLEATTPKQEKENNPPASGHTSFLLLVHAEQNEFNFSGRSEEQTALFANEEGKTQEYNSEILAPPQFV